MLRAIALLAALLCAGPAPARTTQCAPIDERIAQISFSGSGESEEVTVLLPKTHEGADFLSASIAYSKIVVPVDIWPGDKGTVEAHFKVIAGHEQFELRATYAVGSCYRDYFTAIQPWAIRHK